MPFLTKPTATFDRYAEDYDAELSHPARTMFATSSAYFHRRKVDELLAYLTAQGRSPSDLAWLDVGCGRGDLLAVGKQHFASAVGCDPSLSMLAYCGGLPVVHQPEPQQLPFGDDSQDLVTASCVLHHTDPATQARLVAEGYRVLRPGGIIAVFEHNPWNPVTQLIVRTTPLDADARLLTANHSIRLCREAGFASLVARYFLFFPEFLYRKFPRSEASLRQLPVGGQYAVFGRKLDHY